MRRVLITGANRGLGLEFVRQCVERGDKVIAACRKPSQATDLNKLAFAHPGRLTILPVDLLKPNSIAELAREVAMVVDTLDLLINNAGIKVDQERFGELDGESLNRCFANNVTGSVLLTQACLPLLLKGSAARVANIGSVLGSIGRRDGFFTPSYCISKAALNMATRLMAFELAARGVIHVVLHPGWVQTDMGGSQAPLKAVDAITGLLRVIDGLSLDDSGGFFAYDGEPLPW